MRDAFIIDAVRTPRARRKGKFSTVHPVDLLTYPLNALITRNKITASAVEDVVMGCVTQCGEQSWCIARSAILAAGWPVSVPGTTVNRLCGSSQQATNFVAAGIQSGNYELAVAGGIEHMTRVPMFSDVSGEESPMLKKQHPDLVQQGMAAELLSEQFHVHRPEIDKFAFESQMRAKASLAESRFAKSVVSVPCKDEQGKDTILEMDDNPRPDTTVEKLATLKTVFKESGVITAGNASAIVDGAAAILLASEAKVKQISLKPRARIVSMVSIGSDPRIMLSGPIEASKQALTRAKLKVSDIDLWEINEAFAPVPIITIREVGIDPAKVNVNGGAIALGHPLGATGAILIVTALDELERTKKRYALITMCIGLGMGIATVIERV